MSARPALAQPDDAASAPLVDRAARADAIELALHAGQLLMERGAESQRVQQTVRVWGEGLGCPWSSVVVTDQAIFVTHVFKGESHTYVRDARPASVDMSLIEEISHLSHRVEDGRLDRAQARQALAAVASRPRRYSPAVTCLAAGVACAAFSRILLGDLPAFALVVVASSCAAWLRHHLTVLGVNWLLRAGGSGLVAAGLVAGLEHWLLPSAKLPAALAACVLLLVPGVPAINAVADLLKGHTSAGVARVFQASLVVLASAVGLVLASWLSGMAR